MLSTFYRRYSSHLLCLVGLSFPYLLFTAETLPSNNDIETWLPVESEVRTTYDAFKQKFGGEEIILIGLDSDRHSPQLVEALCERVEDQSTIRRCWSPARMQQTMGELGVSKEEAAERLRGLSISKDGSLIGCVAVLSPAGLEDRAAAVADVNEVIEYCQLDPKELHLAGGPVVVAELDALGNQKNNKQFFLITLGVCLCLLYYSLREWKLTLSILGLTVWAINMSLASLAWLGYEMNFILGALSVMVMVFTLAIVVHFLHYYTDSSEKPDPLGHAIMLAWKPCCLATLTTTIGLLSLMVSDIGPVKQFGVAASIGCVVALFTGLGLTPAVLTVLPQRRLDLDHENTYFSRLGHWLLDRPRAVSFVTVAVLGVACIGLSRLESKIDPLDFLPQDGKVRQDVLKIQSDLTETDSLEGVVDFGKDSDLPFAQKLERVRGLEKVIASHPSIAHTMSLATFFPDELPSTPLELTSLLKRARQRQGSNDFATSDQRYWRISARYDSNSLRSKQETYDDLVISMADQPIRFTGIAPLIDGAQKTIFDGFWESFSTAFGIITVVMIVSLWNWRAGLVAMIPNLTPICMVFGTLGWIGFPIDIGMMMTGSIALGIAVDGTFHFLVRYQSQFKTSANSAGAARNALLHTGPPILQAALIASIGMLALTLSSFGPTARFGYLMATMLIAALVGDLVLLPCLLSLRPRKTSPTQNHTPEQQLAPHFDRGVKPSARRKLQRSR